jgi:hypothetical protein
MGERGNFRVQKNTNTEFKFNEKQLIRDSIKKTSTSVTKWREKRLISGKREI